MIWLGLDPRFDMEQLGYLPGFLSNDDPRPAREQFDANYQHGGGWRPYPDGEWTFDDPTITYPGDPPLSPIAMTTLRDEAIFFYPHALVMIIQPDDSFEIARMD